MPSPALLAAAESAWLSASSPALLWSAVALAAAALAVAGFAWFTGRKVRLTTTETIEQFDERLQDLELILHHRERDLETIYANLEELGQRLNTSLAETAPWLVDADVRLTELTEVAEQLRDAFEQLDQAERRHGKQLRQILLVLAALRDREPVVTVEPFVSAGGAD